MNPRFNRPQPSGKFYRINQYIRVPEVRVIDAPLKPFERAFTTLGNVTRVVGYRTISAKYKREGYTVEKNPELFKGLFTFAYSNKILQASFIFSKSN